MLKYHLRLPCSRSSWLCACVLAPALLTACGGGGGDDGTVQPSSTSSGSAKYAGDWVSRACIDNESSSSRTYMTVTVLSPTSFRTDWVTTVYASRDCSGAGTPSALDKGSDVSVIDGTTQVDGLTADKIRYSTTGTVTASSPKALYYSDGKVIRQSPSSGPIDTAGYPTTLDASPWAIFDKVDAG